MDWPLKLDSNSQSRCMLASQLICLNVNVHMASRSENNLNPVTHCFVYLCLPHTLLLPLLKHPCHLCMHYVTSPHIALHPCSGSNAVLGLRVADEKRLDAKHECCVAFGCRPCASDLTRAHAWHALVARRIQETGIAAPRCASNALPYAASTCVEATTGTPSFLSRILIQALF